MRGLALHTISICALTLVWAAPIYAETYQDGYNRAMQQMYLNQALANQGRYVRFLVHKRARVPVTPAKPS